MRVIIFLAILFFSSCKNTNNYNQVKNGKFYYSYYNKLLNERFNFDIVRTDSLQIETNENTGAVSTFKVKWLSVDTYELYYLSKSSISADSLLAEIEKGPLKIKMLEVKDDFYTYLAIRESVNVSFTDTFWLYKKTR